MARTRKGIITDAPPVPFEPENVVLKRKDIIEDDSVKVRPELNEDTVQRYQAAYEAGEKLPPIKVFRVGRDYILSDGGHRKEAMGRVATKARRDPDEEPMDVLAYTPTGGKIGTHDEIFVAGLKGNREHGLQLSREDIGRAIKRLDGMRMFNESEIARMLNVGRDLVRMELGKKASTTKADLVEREQRKSAERTPEPAEDDSWALQPDSDDPLDQPLHPGTVSRERTPRERAYDRLRRPTPGEVSGYGPESAGTNGEGRNGEERGQPTAEGGPTASQGVDAVTNGNASNASAGDLASEAVQRDSDEYFDPEDLGQHEEEVDRVILNAEQDATWESVNPAALFSDTLTDSVSLKVELRTVLGTPVQAKQRFENFIKSYLITEEGSYTVTITDHSGECSREECGGHAI